MGRDRQDGQGYAHRRVQMRKALQRLWASTCRPRPSRTALVVMARRRDAGSQAGLCARIRKRELVNVRGLPRAGPSRWSPTRTSR